MTHYQFVTTFSPAGYQLYGRRMLESFLSHSALPIMAYHESQPDVMLGPEWRNLDHDPDRARFIQDHGADRDKVGSPRDPNSQSIRFCHKIFAVTAAAQRADAEWLVWIDADTLITNDITTQDMLQCCPVGSDLAFLGRRDMPYTECGFVAYRLGNQRVRAMLDDMRRYYTTGEIFTRPRSDWHDSRCFDICRDPARAHIPLERQRNLSANIPGAHVWPHTCLARWSIHQKGPGRKAKSYGGIVP